MESIQIRGYIEECKKLYDLFMTFIESTINSDKDFEDLINFITELKYQDDSKKMESFLAIISSISEEHNRQNFLLQKLEKILLYFSETINKNLTNLEIFEIFKHSKILLLLLIKSKIIIVDKDTVSYLNRNFMFYKHFFYPEIKPFIDETFTEVLKQESKIYNYTFGSDFDDKRLIGENDNHICTLIREDSIEDFIIFINKTNIPVNSLIPYSIFETNNFLINNHPISLIEYAAFFGSIQIFKYLYINKAYMYLTPLIWHCSIHGRNAEIIEQLEENHIELFDKTYTSCFVESIICNHNEIANYFENYLTPEIINSYKSKTNGKIISAITSSNNYCFFPDSLSEFFIYYCLCSKGYNELIDIYLHLRSTEKNEKKIQQIIF